MVRLKASAELLERTLGQRLKDLWDFASILAAHVRERLRSLAAIRHSIGARLLTAVVLFSGFITLILTVIELYIDYRRDISAIELGLNQISGSYLDSLAEGLWALDEKQLRLQLDGILRLPDIRTVEVREAGTTGNPLLIKRSRGSESLAFAREYPLRHEVQGQEMVIGTLRVEGSLFRVYRRLLDTAWTILVGQAAEIFLISFFILYVFHYLVTRHLSAIAARLGSHSIIDLPLELRLRRHPPRYEDELQRLITAFNTLSNRLHTAYRDLREREARIRRLVDSNIIGIFIWDFDGRVLEANDAFLHMVGYDREDLVAGRIRWTDLTPPEWHDRDAHWIQEHKRTGVLPPIEKEYIRKEGTRVPILLGATTFEEGGRQGVAFVLDLTERRRMEAEAQQSELRYRDAQMELARANRVSTLGQLTASVAHEVSQPIATARNNASAALHFLDRNPPDIKEVREALSCIVSDTDRAGEIIGRIRDHIKKVPPRKNSFDLNGAIHEVIALARSEAARNGVSVHVRLTQGLSPVQADRVQLQQVVLNLILNAVEAMSSVNEGPRELLIGTEWNQTDGVLVAVRDSGPGIDPAHLEHVFEAFYTTKSSGVGMGLSICQSIIHAHGGRLWAEANKPKGAVFLFTLPADKGTS